MKRFPNGLIKLDVMDIICFGFWSGSILAYALKRYKIYKSDIGQDLIIQELKRKSPIMMVCKKKNYIKLPLMRGGENILGIKGFYLLLKSEKLSKIVITILNARKNQRRLRELQTVLFILNQLLTSATGFRIATGVSVELNLIQIILFALPSTLGGFVIASVSNYPLQTALLPILLLFGRGIEDVQDSKEKCKFICKYAETYHNNQLQLEMKNLDLFVEKPLLCIEQPLSLVERYKLKEIIKSDKARQRVQHYGKFIKKFSECEPEPEKIYEQIIGNVRKIPIN